MITCGKCRPIPITHTKGLIYINNPTILVEKFMNWVCMIGLKYDASRHIKRTWMHFTPGSHLDFSNIDPGDLVPNGESIDWSTVLINGQRNPEQLKEYYSTNLKGT